MTSDRSRPSSDTSASRYRTLYIVKADIGRRGPARAIKPPSYPLLGAVPGGGPPAAIRRAR